MKKIAAILFALALLLTQTFVVNGTVAQVSPSERGQCACNNHQCCVNRSAPDSSPLPFAPVRSGNSAPSFWLQAWITASLTQPATPAAALSRVASFLPKIGRVPLYQQNCAYLL